MEKKQDGLTLSDMIRGIQHCVNTSVEIAEQHYIKTLDKFFREDGSLITQSLRLGDNVQLEVPLICLTNHGSLDFDEMKIKTRLHLNDAEKKVCKTDLRFGEENYEFTRSSFGVSLGDAPNGIEENSLAEIEMVFKRKEPPEALARLVDHINNMIKITEKQESEESI